MLAGLFVVLFVEATDELLEDSAHAMVVETRGGEVEAGVEVLLDQRAEGIGLGQSGDLIAELEVVEDLLHVGREAVEVRLEVELEAGRTADRAQIPQGEAGGVVEVLACGLAESSVPIDNSSRREGLVGLDDVVPARLKNTVEAAEDSEREDHIPVLAAHVEVAQDVVGNGPNQGDESSVTCRVHNTPLQP